MHRLVKFFFLQNCSERFQATIVDKHRSEHCLLDFDIDRDRAKSLYVHFKSIYFVRRLLAH